MIGPDASAIARLTVATSSPSDVRGSCTAVTERPLAARNEVTLAQLAPSAQAPCTRITSDSFAISPSLRRVRLPRPCLAAEHTGFQHPDICRNCHLFGHGRCADSHRIDYNQPPQI